MSYIRSDSNPEGLYIIGCINGRYRHVEVVGPVSMRVPVGVFHEACLRWSRCMNEEKGITHHGLRIRECYMDCKTGRVIGVQEQNRNDKLWLRGRRKEARPIGGYQIEVSYRGNRFWCWTVTWEYILRDVLAEIADAKKHPKRAWWKS